VERSIIIDYILVSLFVERRTLEAKGSDTRRLVGSSTKRPSFTVSASMKWHISWIHSQLASIDLVDLVNVIH
jgi:hypothetical protein